MMTIQTALLQILLQGADWRMDCSLSLGLEDTGKVLQKMVLSGLMVQLGIIHFGQLDILCQTVMREVVVST